MINTIENLLKDFWGLINRDVALSIFTISLFGYGLLYFVPNNKLLLVLFVVLATVYHWKVKSFWLAIWLVYLFFLPFERGMTYSITIVPVNIGNGGVTHWTTFTYADIAFLLLLFQTYKDRVFGNNIIKMVRGVDFILLFFLLCGFLPVFLTAYKEVALLSFIRLARGVVVYWITRDYLFRYKNKLLLVLSVLSASILFEGVWAILQFIKSSPIGKSIEQFAAVYSPYGHLAFENLTLFRPSGTFIDPNYLASFLTILLPLFFAYLFVKKTDLRVLVSLIVLFVGTISLFITQSRGAWIVFGGTILLFVLYLRNRSKNEMNIVAKMVVKKLMIITLFFVPILVIPRINNFLQVFDKYGSGYYRLDLINKSIELANQYPFGIGLGTFPAYVANGYQHEEIGVPASPHNIFAHIGVEMGILGLLTFIVFILIIIKKRIGVIYDSDEHFYLKSGIYFSWLAFIGVASFYPLFLVPNIFDYFFIFSALL